jgi:hypothetical protein
MRKLYISAAIMLAIACADSTKKSVTKTDSSQPVIVQSAAIDSEARRNTDFGPARTDAIKALESFRFDSARVDSVAIYGLSLDELRLLRGLVFGRHGRHFEDDAFIQSYLVSQAWYKPNSYFTNDSLNDVERANLDIIRGAEAARHDRIMPGDLRYHRGKVITAAMLGKHTFEEWELLSTELWAINGHKFYGSGSDDYGASMLQEYYDERYWYKPVKQLRYAELPAQDRLAIDTITLARIDDLDGAVTFGMMRLFQNRRLEERNLKFTQLFDLRLMRNEVYALHGRAFTTPWIKRELEAQGYQPTGNFSEAALSQIEKDNVALIRRFEELRHEDLSTREIMGQWYVRYPLGWVRLLRNELYARHGKIFTDQQLQAYFAAMPWYKPDPAFKESMLTELERKNAQTLLDHEKLIRSGGRYPEG